MTDNTTQRTLKEETALFYKRMEQEGIPAEDITAGISYVYRYLREQTENTANIWICAAVAAYHAGKMHKAE